MPPAIPICLPDREAISHPPSPMLCYPLLSSLVPLIRHSIWSASASLHPSFYLFLSPPASVTFFLYQFSSFLPAPAARPPHTGTSCSHTSVQMSLLVPLHRSSSLVFVKQGGEGIHLIQSILFMATDCSLGGHIIGDNLSLCICMAPGKLGLNQGV